MSCEREKGKNKFVLVYISTFYSYSPVPVDVPPGFFLTKQVILFNIITRFRRFFSDVTLC